MTRSPRSSMPAGGRRGEPRAPRTLFLDDDPSRAEVFLAENPQAVWVQTAEECISRLTEPWDEVHLDHDLGGEHFVDHSRADCGMEVVRWLCLGVRPHLAGTRFVVHTHNANAATLMGMQMMVSGYKVDVRPFGSPPDEEDEPVEAPSFLKSLWGLVRRLLGSKPADDYGYVSYRLDPSLTPPPLPEPFDFTWPTSAHAPGPDDAPPGASAPHQPPTAGEAPVAGTGDNS